MVHVYNNLAPGLSPFYKHILQNSYLPTGNNIGLQHDYTHKSALDGDNMPRMRDLTSI